MRVGIDAHTKAPNPRVVNWSYGAGRKGAGMEKQFCLIEVEDELGGFVLEWAKQSEGEQA
jgi:hypothetical protein